MEVKSILCDAATVREGLLHILGGGITRIWRPEYPAPFTGALAIVIQPHATEVGIEHSLVVKIASQDGRELGKLEAQFTVRKGDDSEPGEIAVIPMVIDFSSPPLVIPEVGGYSIDVLIDQQHKDSLSFLARIRTA